MNKTEFELDGAFHCLVNVTKEINVYWVIWQEQKYYNKVLTLGQYENIRTLYSRVVQRLNIFVVSRDIYYMNEINDNILSKVLCDVPNFSRRQILYK